MSWRRTREVPIPIELELKLAADTADLHALRTVLAAIAPGAPQARRRLVSTYFDTPDLALHQADANLRVRVADGGFIQTFKTRGSGANLLARGEWEDTVAGNEPDPTAPHSGARLPEGVAGLLRPLFLTEVVRETLDIEPAPGTRVEAAIDIGEIRAIGSGATEPISEIELELKAGDPADLYDIALKLHQASPLRIDLRSKSDRGYSLVRSEPGPAAVRAEAVSFDPGAMVATVVGTIGRSCLAHLLRNEPAALAGGPEGVHQMRVALRRLRSLLSSFKKMLPPDERRAVADRLAQFAAPLGAARNLDVFAAELLEPLRGERGDEPGWDELAAAVERAREEAYRRVKQELLSPRHTEATLHLMRWFDGPGRFAWNSAETPATTPIVAVAAHILDRRRRNLRRRSRNFTSLTPKERHRLRIAAKKMRYTVEQLRSLYPRRDARRFVKQLQPVQDGLGHANDVRVAYGLVIGLGKAAEHAEAIAAAGGQLLELHERALLRGEPKLAKHLRRLNRARRFWRT